MDIPLGSPLPGRPSGPLHLHCILHCHYLLRAPEEVHCHVGSSSCNPVRNSRFGNKSHAPGIYHPTRQLHLRGGAHVGSHYPIQTPKRAGRSNPEGSYCYTSRSSCRGRGGRNCQRGRTDTTPIPDLRKEKMKGEYVSQQRG